jgi:hypothetical protein
MMVQAAIPRRDMLLFLYALASYELRCPISSRKRNLFVCCYTLFRASLRSYRAGWGTTPFEWAYIYIYIYIYRYMDRPGFDPLRNEVLAPLSNSQYLSSNAKEIKHKHWMKNRARYVVTQLPFAAPATNAIRIGGLIGLKYVVETGGCEC